MNENNLNRVNVMQNNVNPATPFNPYEKIEKPIYPLLKGERIFAIVLFVLSVLLDAPVGATIVAANCVAFLLCTLAGKMRRGC